MAMDRGMIHNQIRDRGDHKNKLCSFVHMKLKICHMNKINATRFSLPFATVSWTNNSTYPKLNTFIYNLTILLTSLFLFMCRGKRWKFKFRKQLVVQHGWSIKHVGLLWNKGEISWSHSVESPKCQAKKAIFYPKDNE